MQRNYYQLAVEIILSIVKDVFANNHKCTSYSIGYHRLESLGEFSDIYLHTEDKCASIHLNENDTPETIKKLFGQFKRECKKIGLIIMTPKD